MKEQGKGDEQHGRIQERLDRYRQGLPSEGTGRARKTARSMLFINVILIAVMFFFYQTSKEPEYHTATLEAGTLLYRLSISHDRKTRTYITSLTVKSTAPAAKDYVFSTGAIGKLMIYAGDVNLLQIPLGEVAGGLHLRPGEARSHVMPLPGDPLLAYAKAHPGMLVPRRRVFLFSGKQHLPLQARFSPGNNADITATIDFRFEVQ